MRSRPVFQNISPLDHRYSISESAVFDALTPFLSEDANVSACVKVEIALLNAHLRNAGIAGAVSEASISITPEEVYAEEETTKHFIRALVNVLKKKAPAKAAPFIHLGATSADILDTALALRIKGAVNDAALPQLRALVAALAEWTEREAATPQVGRTHGQQAVPITAGFAMAEYVARLGKCAAEIEKRAADLRGKLSGAVGAYNALSLIVKDPEAFEAAFLENLGLAPPEYSNQLVEPEYLLRLLLEMNIAFGILANLADDLRSLQRSEIDEVRESFGDSQVGSSTMPQKRNPWNSEHVKSLWKTFCPHVVTFFMDQISEHQRDLTGSASQRFTASYITGFCMAVSRTRDIISGLQANRARMSENLHAGSGAILAEAAYILLAECGVSNAHEIVRRVTLAAEKEGLTFASAFARETDANECVTKRLRELGLIAPDAGAAAFWEHPELYSGLAEKRAREIAKRWKTGDCTKNGLDRV